MSEELENRNAENAARTRVPLFEPVSAPRLTSLAKRELIKFKRSYQEYLVKLNRAGDDDDEDHDRPASSIRRVFQEVY